MDERFGGRLLFRGERGTYVLGDARELRHIVRGLLEVMKRGG